MPDKEFELFDEQTKNDIAYKACIGGMTAVGITMGSLAGGQAILGGVGGLIWGLMTCKALSAPIKQKLFSRATKMSHAEVASLLKEIRNQRPYINKKEAIKVLAYIRMEVPRNADKYGQQRLIA